MPTITARKRKDGTTAYRAEVRIMRDGKQAFKAVQTFDSKPQARAWAAALEAEWETRAMTPERPSHTVATVIRKYLERLDGLQSVGRTRRAVLAAAARSELGAKTAADVAAADLICYAEQRRAAGAGPATVLIDYSCLRTLFAEAKPLLGLALDDTAFRDARPLLVKLGLIALPARRKRRPLDVELDRLLAHFRKRSQHVAALLPMADIVEFAVYTCLRQGEICRVTWADLDETRRTLIVRNRKAPQGKEGNDQEIPLLGPALAVALRQPRDSARIFPYDPRSVSAAFTRVCAALGIEDLHFHDLRREGASRLLEMGYTIPEVATVTGHRDLNILWRVYSQITPEHLHEKYKEG
jgi:integrase